MTDFCMFFAALRNHPGVKLACMWTAMTAFAMAARNDIHEFSLMGGLAMVAIFSSMAWLPVLVTAWLDRHIFSGESND